MKKDILTFIFLTAFFGCRERTEAPLTEAEKHPSLQNIVLLHQVESQKAESPFEFPRMGVLQDGKFQEFQNVGVDVSEKCDGHISMQKKDEKYFLICNLEGNLANRIYLNKDSTTVRSKDGRELVTTFDFDSYVELKQTSDTTYLIDIK